MKKLRNIITVLLVSLSPLLYATWPESSFLISDKTNKAPVFKNTSSIFVTQEKKQIRNTQGFTFTPASQINADYITGLTKKTESKVVRILNWDFKVKFRLNRNMNIIFSYN